MSFSRRDHADATQIVTTGDHDQVARVELDVVLDLLVLQVETNRVVDLDVRVGVANGSAIMSNDHWNAFGRHQNLSYFTQFVLNEDKQQRTIYQNEFDCLVRKVLKKGWTYLSLLFGDAMNSESTFDVVDESEVLVGLLNCDDIFFLLRR